MRVKSGLIHIAVMLRKGKYIIILRRNSLTYSRNDSIALSLFNETTYHRLISYVLKGIESCRSSLCNKIILE